MNDRKLRIKKENSVDTKSVLELTAEELVKAGCVLKAERDLMDKRLSEIGRALKDKAREEQKNKYAAEGPNENYEAQISTHTITSVPTGPFVELAEELGVHKEGIMQALSVKVAQAKKVVPEDSLMEIASTSSDPYGKVQFKIKPKK